VTGVEQLAEERALRADAQRNLARILDAAREVFAEAGAEASVADVAERAGVGTATIFRRFPTKDDLLAAVVEARLLEIAANARRAAESTDPGGALRRFMTWTAAAHISDRGYCHAEGTALFAQPRIGDLVAELGASVETLLQRAKEAGEVREDVTASDISILLMAVGQAGIKLEPAAPGIWQRYLDIILDGLRPEGARPLSRRPLTRKQLVVARSGAPRPGA
jgi:AcrR family transcriptional regulator